jgi:hypothetical protein
MEGGAHMKRIRGRIVLFLTRALVIALFCCCSGVNAATEWKIPFGPREGHTVSRLGQDFNGSMAVGVTAMKALDDGSVLLLDSTYERIVELTPQGAWKQAIPIPKPGAEWINWRDFARLQDGRYLVLNHQGTLFLLEPGKGALKKFPDQSFDLKGAQYIDAGLSADNFYISCPGYSYWAGIKGNVLGMADHTFFQPVPYPEERALYGVNQSDISGGQGAISVISFADKGKKVKTIIWKRRNQELKLQALSVLSIEVSGYTWIVAAEGKTGNYEGMVRYIARIDSTGKASTTFSIPLSYEMNTYWKRDVVANRKGNVFGFHTDTRNFCIVKYR